MNLPKSLEDEYNVQMEEEESNGLEAMTALMLKYYNLSKELRFEMRCLRDTAEYNVQKTDDAYTKIYTQQLQLKKMHKVLKALFRMTKSTPKLNTKLGHKRYVKEQKRRLERIKAYEKFTYKGKL